MRRNFIHCAVLVAASCLSGCATGGSTSVANRVEHDLTSRRNGTTDEAPPRSDDAIAIVDGQPIARRRLVDMLLRSGGVGLLEQLIVLDKSERLASERGITVTDADVRKEYEEALRMLTDPMAAVTTGKIDREDAERTLMTVLAQRNVSKEEFMLGMRRRAYLRRIVEADMNFGENDYQREFRRRYGERVEVRHIQLASGRLGMQLKSQLEAGADFVELARRHSANLLSAEAGGLLQPFSMSDDAVPETFRSAAFSLKEGQVAGPVQVGEWYHLIRLEKRLPAGSVKLDDVRTDLRRSLEESRREPAIQSLYEKLFRDARITIRDPVLRKAFEEVHGSR